MPFSPKKPKRLRGRRPPTLRIADILAWADEHKARTGKWPLNRSGAVRPSHRETWNAIDKALRYGTRGLPGGSSLPRLLAERRGYRNSGSLPNFSVATILAWADDHKARTGKFPKVKAGRVRANPSESWTAIDHALREGKRGLPGGSSLAQLLEERRGHPNRLRLPKFSLKSILGWADEFKRRKGRFPSAQSGPIESASGETWRKIATALKVGLRGLPGGQSLAGILAQHRGHRNHMRLPRLTEAKILRWADDHKRRRGQFPTDSSGPIHAAPGEKWRSVSLALLNGARGLPGGSTLAQLLTRRRGERNRKRPPPYKLTTILKWADAFKRRHGRFPRRPDGPIADAPGETWNAVEVALRQGKRGLPGGSSLAQLLAERRGVRNSRSLPPLTVSQVLAWADAHKQRTGNWPTSRSGPIVGTSGETWATVDHSLRRAQRGLRRRSSVPQLLATKRGVIRQARHGATRLGLKK